MAYNYMSLGCVCCFCYCRCSMFCGSLYGRTCKTIRRNPKPRFPYIPPEIADAQQGLENIWVYDTLKM